MESYTAGPWAWEEHAVHKGRYCIRVQTDGYAPLAIVCGDKRSTFKQAHANAMLIAQAPELVKLLAFARDCLLNGNRPTDLQFYQMDLALYYANGGES